MLLTGIFIIAPVTGAAGDRIREINREFDPKLAGSKPPHITLTGSSGAGPLDPSTDRDALLEKLSDVAAETAPFSIEFGKPERFLQTNIVVLPIAPHGPIRVLHDRIVASGLRFAPARFTFTPHCTLSLYRSLTPEAARALLSVRVGEPVNIDRIEVYLTREPQPSKLLLELELKGEAAVR